MGKLIDLTGQRFGRLIVVKEAGRNNQGKALWLCKCDCGKETVANGCHLRQGNIQSCGCYRKEILNYHLKKRISDTCDGHSSSRLYIIWQQMKMRCYNPKNDSYARYGGRGIRICNEWMDFGNFKMWAMSHGYQENLTIDRINVNGNYEPQNCRWVDYFIQANNTSRNVILSFQGEQHTISEWSRIRDISARTICSRIRRGWEVQDILTIKPRPGNRRKKKNP